MPESTILKDRRLARKPKKNRPENIEVRRVGRVGHEWPIGAIQECALCTTPRKVPIDREPLAR